MGERARVGDGKVRQHLAIDVVAGLLQTIHQSAVRNLVLPGGRVDADDPESAKVPLLGLAVPVGVDQRLLDLELGHPVGLGLGSVVALRESQRLGAAILPLGSSFYAWHFLLLIAPYRLMRRAAFP